MIYQTDYYEVLGVYQSDYYELLGVYQAKNVEAGKNPSLFDVGSLLFFYESNHIKSKHIPE